MKPYPDVILKSMQYSLDTYIIPNINDKWGIYVAKVMRHVLTHLERRWKLEGPLLVEDTNDIKSLLTDLQEKSRSSNLGPDHRDQLHAIVQEALANDQPPSDGYVSIEILTERNNALREALVKLIESLDDVRKAGQGDAIEPFRHQIRKYLRRQIDRDNQLAGPCSMSFAPPKPKESSGSKKATA